jgi:prepilin-type N-terminal cleavage/methylation domain-containing protein
MLSNLRKSKKEQGFTIIEVLIVLAIAGLILLIVFLAVPALQRNSRNTQRKDDVSRIGSAVQEFINNNNGTTPTTSATDISSIQGLLGTLAYYKNTNVTVVAATTGVTVADTDHVSIVVGATCKSDGAGGQEGTSTGATTRQVAVVYKTEAGSGDTNLCVAS